MVAVIAGHRVAADRPLADHLDPPEAARARAAAEVRGPALRRDGAEAAGVRIAGLILSGRPRAQPAAAAVAQIVAGCRSNPTP
jgi:hypothetical protein